MTIRFQGDFDALLIGEAPSASSDPWSPLSGATGKRLRRWIGRDPSSVFGLANLLDRYPGKGYGKGSHWPAALAKRRARRAARILAVRGMPARLILVGNRVAAAFGFKKMEPLRWRPARVGGRRVDVALLPHPSGCNMWYNHKRNQEAAARFLRREARR